MKLGLSTGNSRGTNRGVKIARCDRFLNFTFIKNGEFEHLQFFNQTDPQMAAQMLRKLADTIEEVTQL